MNKRIKILLAASVTAILIFLSRNIVIDSFVFNVGRGLLLFVSGLVALILLTQLISSKISKRWLKKLFLTGWSIPGLLSLFVLTGVSCCSFDGRHPKSHDEDLIPNGRVYVAPYGDQGALGQAGEAVYIEKNIFGPFFTRKSLCISSGKYAMAYYKLIDKNTIECEDGNKKLSFKID